MPFQLVQLLEAGSTVGLWPQGPLGLLWVSMLKEKVENLGGGRFCLSLELCITLLYIMKTEVSMCLNYLNLLTNLLLYIPTCLFSWIWYIWCVLRHTWLLIVIFRKLLYLPNLLTRVNQQPPPVQHPLEKPVMTQLWMKNPAELMLGFTLIKDTVNNMSGKHAGRTISGYKLSCEEQVLHVSR